MNGAGAAHRLRYQSLLPQTDTTVISRVRVSKYWQTHWAGGFRLRSPVYRRRQPGLGLGVGFHPRHSGWLGRLESCPSARESRTAQSTRQASKGADRYEMVGLADHECLHRSAGGDAADCRLRLSITWSTPASNRIKLVGVVVLIVSFIPLTWALSVNRFFEGTVRIQTNRGHQVISSGPYRYVRHPGYVGVIAQFIAIPLVLGTSAAWIPALMGVSLYICRTWLEDRTLRAELPGYADFAHHTRYRLIPGVW